MKRAAGIAAIAAFVMAGTSISFAAGDKKAEKTPQVGTWEYQWAMETGKLPSGDGGSKVKTDFDKNVTIVEIGGRVYRLGIDTP